MQLADKCFTQRDCSSFSYWREAVCETFVDLDCRQHNSSSFRGQIQNRQLLDVSFVTVSATPHTVVRDAQRIARSSDDFFLLSIIHEGEMGIEQRGRMTRLQRGEFAIYDTTEPYRIILDQPFVQSVLRFDRKEITDRVLNPSLLTSRAVACDKGMGAITSTYIRQLGAQLEEVFPMSGRQLRNTLLDLVAASLKDLDGESAPPVREGHHFFLNRALSFVEDNLLDETLSCESVAQAMGVSSRYLRKLFEGRKHTLSEWIWHRRLEESLKSLGESQGAQRSITAIAYDLGFKDPAHFSKAFKVKFGMTPREYRLCGATGPAH
ncbi:helix-turn-helix domain-containing protein [Novosphingobium sp. PP1Y]|uniref:AraC-like ligand-binding domain-containing protein n=1 Tax=Novosphingobium sp. PP1Y TaxID=702113 RepID=UPI00020EF9F4|nr:helix-turn-helix domain-containing protein [Novosphingobium sp. PP1Y]CCA90682.1 AraC family transcriptional regulator [Novosphingobium sp. PP1Y]